MNAAQDIATTSSPTFTNLTLSGNLGVGGSLSITGNVGVGKSLNVTDLGVFDKGVNVTGLSNLTGLNATTINATSLDTTGNLGIGKSGSITSYLSVGSLYSSGAVCLGSDCRTSWPAGGGESTTASNGLNLSGSDVRLGGALTQATGIDVNNQSFGFLRGNLGVGTTVSDYNFKVVGTGYFSDFLGVGTSMNISGNLGIGRSLTVTSGTVFSGGLAVSGGSVVLPSSVITNSNLVNSGLTVTAGTGLTGGGAVSLGGTVTLNAAQDIATTSSPTFTNLTLTGNLGIGGSLVTTGNVGVGKSLNVTDLGVFDKGVNVTGLSNLTGNVGVGGSMTLGSTSNFRLSGQNCTGLTNGGKLTTDASGNVYCAADVSGASSAAWSSITVPTTNLTLAMDADTTAFNWDTMTSETAWSMASTSINSGTLMELKNSNTTSTAQSSDLLKLTYAPGVTLADTTTVSGNLLDISRDLLIDVGGARSISVTGAVVSISDNCAVGTGDTCTHSGSVLVLDQNWSSSTGIVLDIDNAGSGASLAVRTGNVGIGFTSPKAALHVRQTNSANVFLVEDQADDTQTPFVINQDGNVGIGNSAPSLKLDVVGAGRFSENVGIGASLTVTSGVRFSSSLDVTGNTNLSTLATTGNVGIGRSLTVASGATFSSFVNADSFLGAGLTADCDGDTQTLGWDITTSKFTCGDDDTTGGSDNSGLESVQVFTTANDGVDAYNESIAAITHLMVELVGGGGGGGDGTTGDFSGGGGGGGYSAEIIEVYSANEDVTVGAGGPGGTADDNGQTGGTSSFGDATADLQATGGLGGTVDADGGDGGVGSNGDINLVGGGGGAGTTTATISSGMGGSSYFGGGGEGHVDTTASDGNAPGSGGAGGVTTGTGGNGAEGIVIVWEYSGTAGSDYAEYYETDGTASAGDLVGMGDAMFEYTNEDGVQRMAVLEKGNTENRLVGVVSTRPGIEIGKEIKDFAKNPRPIALAGRVPTKVSNMNGQIKKGDLLTASSIPGVAMKSTKAGQIIGSAMEDFNGAEGQIGKITVFINTGYSTGARAKQLLLKEGIEIEESTLDMKVDVDKLLLAQLISQKKQITNDTPISEIYTDRVIAGLSVISPRVLTDQLVADSIEALEQDLVVKLTSDGKFIIAGQAEATDSAAPVVTFDSLGNATFVGTITADKIRANQIEGLELIVSRVKSQESSEATASAQLDSLTTQIVSESAQTISLDNLLQQASASAKLAESLEVEEDSIRVLRELRVDKSATFGLDMAALGKLTVGELHVKQNTIFDGLVHIIESLTTRNIIVTDWAQFLADVLFKGDVNFEGRTTFKRVVFDDKDTAGGALIKKDADSVEVVFEKEYAQLPLVNISITLDEEVTDEDRVLLDPKELELRIKNQQLREKAILDGDLRYIVVRRNTKGFIIKLNKPTPADVKFSWNAIAVKDAKTAVSNTVIANEVKQSPVTTEIATSSSTTLRIPRNDTVLNPSSAPIPAPSPTPIESGPTPLPSPSPAKTITINETELGYLRVRDGPDTSFEEIGQVNVGQTFEVFEESDPSSSTSSGSGQVWYQIEYQKGQYGWISGSYVMLQ